jgi:hypothetical protein
VSENKRKKTARSRRKENEQQEKAKDREEAGGDLAVQGGQSASGKSVLPQTHPIASQPSPCRSSALGENILDDDSWSPIIHRESRITSKMAQNKHW